MALFVPPPSHQTRDIGYRVTRPLVILMLVLAVVVFMITPVLALDWSRRVPFPRVLVGQTFIVGDANSGKTWGPTPELDLLDRIIAINGTPITNQISYELALINTQSRLDRSAHITFERSIALSPIPCGQIVRPGIRQCEVDRSPLMLASDDFARLFVLPYVIGLIYLIVGVWVFRQRGRQRAGLALTFFTSVVAMSLATYFDQESTNALVGVYVMSLALSAGSLVTLGLQFPLQPRLIDRHPLLRFAGFVPSVILAGLAIAKLYDTSAPWDYIFPEQYLFLYLAFGLFFFLAVLLYRRLRADSPVVRQQSRIILWGSLLAFLPFLIWVVQGLVNPSTAFEPLLNLPLMALFPISIAYALLRQNLLDVDRVIMDTITYLILTVLVVVSVLGLASITTILLRGQTTLTDNPILLGIFVLVIVVILDPLRRYIHRLVDLVLFRNAYDTQTTLRNYSHDLTEVVELPAIVSRLRQQARRTLRPEKMYIYLLDSRTNAFIVQPDVDAPRLPPAAARLSIDSPLAHWLKAESGPGYLPADRPLPDILLPDQNRLEAIGAILYVPIAGRDQLNGWLALSPKPLGQMYSAEDIAFLVALASQTSLALERAIVFDDLQRRVNELNVLSRISQGVNFTLDPDDILELIYAQTSRVLDTRNFYIAMADPKRDAMRFSFYLEGGERLYPDDEWPIFTGLSGEIMRRGQPIVTDDYVEECRRRGLEPGGRPGLAWMGVPLNAGDRVLGIMCVSDFRPEITYSQEQLQIFAAIADQAASVLDKARLYRETEERARQLAVLNEVAGSITSSLDLRTALSTIVQKAIEILRAEAGSLLLVDEQTNELVFEVTFGPAAPDLRGQRLPFGAGIVGAVAKTRQPQIVNEARADSRWLRDVDQTTAFVTRAILAVPMIVKDRLIGVLELINKLDSDNFTEDDQSLLTAFAINAAVAVENARLFTMTDQALASRVDELSTLQEIDRQLNTSLDIRRVLEITLEWGLRVTDATAGSVGIVDRDQDAIIILATRNYTYQPASLPIGQGLAGQVVRSGQAVLVNDVSQDSRYIAASLNTRSQLSVPIRRENEVIGVINLESHKLNAFGILQLDTASRLADHAAIAIANAGLYEEVKQANEGKSKFVSDVAHELSQPMTSIRGYTDLLSKGMAGPITEMQTQFLGIIRSNVDRMNSLVNDLLEIGRIQTGRLKLDIRPTSLTKVIEETARTMQAQLDERQLTLEYQMPEDLPPVMGDHARLIQIVTNLMSNAYKYTLPGGRITVSLSWQAHIQPPGARGGVAAHSPSPNGSNPDGYVICSVQDTGIGISSEDQAKLFTQFFRSTDPNVRNMPGTGLGLTITKSLIELQQGALWFKSEVGQGSTFTFSIPVAAAQPTQAANSDPTRDANRHE